MNLLMVVLGAVRKMTITGGSITGACHITLPCCFGEGFYTPFQALTGSDRLSRGKTANMEPEYHESMAK